MMSTTFLLAVSVGMKRETERRAVLGNAMVLATPKLVKSF